MKLSVDSLWRALARLGQLAQGGARRALGALREVSARARTPRARRWLVPAAGAAALLYAARLELSLAALAPGRAGDGPLAELARGAEREAARAAELAGAAEAASRAALAAQPEVGAAASAASERSTLAQQDAGLALVQAQSAGAVADAAAEAAEEARRLSASAAESAGGAAERSSQALVASSEASRLAERALALSVPLGTIVAWDPFERDERGNALGERALPAGWALCDGRAGTPNLAHRFLMGVGVPSRAGTYGEASRMGEAGQHGHASDPMVNSFQWFKKGLQNARKNPGEGLMLLDRGFGSDPAAHGAHVHAGDNVPAHYTVVYIVKVALGEAGPLPPQATAIEAQADQDE